MANSIQTVPVGTQQAQEEQDEEDGCRGGIEADDDIGQSSKGGFNASQTQGVTRGWGESNSGHCQPQRPQGLRFFYLQ